jgi:PhzF family phenazine biosynthesis protein
MLNHVERRMPSLAFRIVNVFSRSGESLSGNPLCVFENGNALNSETMQALARQFNLSETTFILASTRASARVRIFTPCYEMPFAGHPTLGSAFVCRAMGVCSDQATLEMQAGIIPVSASGARWTLRANAPTTRACDASRAQLAAMLGLSESDIAPNPLWVKAGKEQLIVPLTSEAAVRAVRPDAAKFSCVSSEDGHSMAYVFALIGAGRALGRFFFPQGSAILEDPATGSATANLGGWLATLHPGATQRLEIDQGEYVGRPSKLFLKLDEQQRIFVSGDVIEVGRGTMTL